MARPDSVAVDWNGWRQADTQTIALHFALERIDPFHPEIAWGGDGSGLVEAEVQIYPAIVALFLRWLGLAEWPGQLISTLAWAMAATCLLLALRRRFNWTASLFGASTMLVCPLAIFLSTTIMPDPMALAFYCLALASFLDYVASKRLLAILIATVSFSVAALIKPIALNLGIVQFILVLLIAPRLLRSPVLWLSWALVLFALGVNLWHGYTNYLASGNSFGVVTPGTDLKFPTVSEIVDLGELARMGWTSIRYCFGAIGVAGAMLVLLRRQIQSEEIALSVGAVAALLISLRYSAGQPHYHIFTVPLVGWIVAHGTQLLLERHAQPAKVLVMALTIILAMYLPALRERMTYTPAPEVIRLAELASRLRQIANPHDLVVVRSLDRAYDPNKFRRANRER
jgi:4-amino-4-deoxy-L-arabinose transferase-like glycosyltransferase